MTHRKAAPPASTARVTPMPSRKGIRWRFSRLVRALVAIALFAILGLVAYISGWTIFYLITH